MRDEIEKVIIEFPGYGYRSVTHALRRQGWPVNHKRVLRIMQEESLLCQLKHQFVPTTDSRHCLGVYPNLVQGLAEGVYLKEYHTFEKAESNLRTFIEEVYNAKRLHSILGYVPHIEFETAFCALPNHLFCGGMVSGGTPLSVFLQSFPTLPQLVSSLRLPCILGILDTVRTMCAAIGHGTA